MTGMEKNIGTLLLSALFFLFFMLMLLLFFIIPNIDERPTESNTVKLTATITHIEIGTEKNGYVIYTSEYERKILVHNDDMAADEINSYIGKVATFRIEQKWSEQWNNASFMPPIVALCIQDKDILTLESFNKRLDDSYRKGRITCAVFGGIFLLLSVYSFLRYKGRFNTVNDSVKMQENGEQTK